MRGLVLSVFPGLDLLGRAFEAEGFCVVRGPDLLWGGDVHTFHPPPGRFDGVIGGPPCQAFSKLRSLVEGNGLAVAPNLIPEFERIVDEAGPRWWLMENVPNAPEPRRPADYTVQRLLIRDHWVGGETRRERAITWGVRGSLRWRPFKVDWPALHRPDPDEPVLASGGRGDTVRRDREKGHGAQALGYKTQAYLETALRGQGLPPDFLAESPLTVAGKIAAVGNGVPMATGLALARAVRRVTDDPTP